MFTEMCTFVIISDSYPIPTQSDLKLKPFWTHLVQMSIDKLCNISNFITMMYLSTFNFTFLHQMC